MSASPFSFLQGFGNKPLWQHLRAALCELLGYATGKGWIRGQHVLLHEVSSATNCVYRLPGFTRISTANAANVHLHALKLPADSFLERPLSVPANLLGKLDDAVRLEVETVSPFGAEDTAWGWRLIRQEAQTLQLTVAIASRATIQRQLAGLRADLARQAEVWAPAASGLIVLDGFGEHTRQKLQQRTLRTTASLAAVALLATALAALTPAWVAREALKEHYRLFANLSQQAQPALQMRTELSALASLQETLAPHLAANGDALSVLEQISSLLPDSVWLSSLTLQDNNLQLNGYAKDGAAVLRDLQEQDGFANVRSVSPLVLDNNWQKERFSIELDLAP